MDNKIISLRSSHLILAGIGASERLGPEAKGMGAKRALVISCFMALKRWKGILETDTILHHCFGKWSWQDI
jgi:hypothetical protein